MKSHILLGGVSKTRKEKQTKKYGEQSEARRCGLIS